MADESLILALIGIDILLFMIMVPLLIWIKLGGYPEGTYRIFRIPYFSAIFIDAGGTPRRYPLRLTELKKEAPDLPEFFVIKKFSNSLGRYYVDSKQATRHNGRDSWYYYPDNPYPIPLRHFEAPFTISASQLEKAFDSKSMEDFLGIGKEKKTKAGHTLRNVAIAIVLFIVIMLGLSLFFSSGVR